MTTGCRVLVGILRLGEYASSVHTESNMAKVVQPRAGAVSEQVGWAFGDLRPPSVFIRSVIGGVAGFLLVSGLLVGLLGWEGVAVLVAALAGAVLGAVAVHRLAWPMKLQRIEFDGTSLVFLNGRAGREELSPELVRLVAGEPAFSTTGHNMMAWKYLHVLTLGGRRTVALEPEEARAAYEALRKVCTGALCVSGEGAVELSVPNSADLEGWLEESAELVRREFRRQAFRSLVTLAVTGTVALVAGVVLALGYGHRTDSELRPVFRVGILSLLAALVSLYLAMHHVGRGVRVGGALRKVMRGRAIDPRVLDVG
jgi:hypothetical protein